MAAKYYVALRPRLNENHAVHKEGCPFLENEERIFLGSFSSSIDAVKASRRHFFSSEGCSFCSKEQKVRDVKIMSYDLIEKELIPNEPEGSLLFQEAMVCCVN
jgi:hypothetical protein